MLAVAALAAGCTVRGDAGEVVIEHHAEYPAFAEMMADTHCARFGKAARQVQSGPLTTTYLWLRGRVSVFECVDETPAPAPGKASP